MPDGGDVGEHFAAAEGTVVVAAGTGAVEPGTEGERPLISHSGREALDSARRPQNLLGRQVAKSGGGGSRRVSVEIMCGVI